VIKPSYRILHAQLAGRIYRPSQKWPAKHKVNLVKKTVNINVNKV